MNPKRFKIPESGYLYLVQRQQIPVNNTKFEIIIDGIEYDVIVSNKNTNLERTSNITISLDNRCIEKCNPGTELSIIESFEKDLGLRLNELILG